VSGKKGVQLHDPGPQPIALCTLRNNGSGVERLGPDLDGDIRVSYQIAARGPLALARWVHCRPPAGGTIHLTFLIGCKRIEA